MSDSSLADASGDEVAQLQSLNGPGRDPRSRHQDQRRGGPGADIQAAARHAANLQHVPVENLSPGSDNHNDPSHSRRTDRTSQPVEQRVSKTARRQSQSVAKASPLSQRRGHSDGVTATAPCAGCPTRAAPSRTSGMTGGHRCGSGPAKPGTAGRESNRTCDFETRSENCSGDTSLRMLPCSPVSGRYDGSRKERAQSSRQLILRTPSLENHDKIPDPR